MKMSELKRFHDMTKPPKHRWLKVLKQGLGDLSSVIKYQVYNVLYKLKIIKRFNRRDETTRQVPFSPRPCPFSVDVALFRALAIPTVIEYRLIDEDYFYTDRKGVKKVLHVMKQEEYIHTVMYCGLQDVSLKLGGKMYKSKLPQIKVMQYDSDNFGKTSPVYRTMTYDLQKVSAIRNAHAVSNDPQEDELKYTYNLCVQEITKFSRTLTLKDLEVSGV